MKSILDVYNGHKISELSNFFSAECTWITLDGCSFSGLKEIQAMWLDRWALFPDFQIVLQKIGDLGPIQYAHVNFLGSVGSNKSIDMAFSTAVILELEWTEKGLKSCTEFGNPLKMLELEGIQKPMTTIESTRVSGFGGIFLKTKDTKKLAAWYDSHLGTRFGENSWSTFKWRERDNKFKIGRTEFSLFQSESDYFAPSDSRFMLNFRVHNLEELLLELGKKNITIVGNTQVFEYGKFAWIIDPDGNKIELWEPIDAVLETYDAN